MKILGICGSPREGASEFLLKRALEELESEGHFTMHSLQRLCGNKGKMFNS